MSLTEKQKEALGVSIALILLTALSLWAAIYFTMRAAESNHVDITPPAQDVKIETERGIEYPKY